MNNKNLSVGVIITSDKCYFNSESKTGYSENDKLGERIRIAPQPMQKMYFIQFKTYFKP